MSIVTWPETGAVQLYHTEFSPSDSVDGQVVRFAGFPGGRPVYAVCVNAGAAERLGGAEAVAGGPHARGVGYVDPVPRNRPPGRVSVTGVLVHCKSNKLPVTPLLGSFSSRSAKAPATCGAAIEVPLSEANAPPARRGDARSRREQVDHGGHVGLSSHGVLLGRVADGDRARYARWEAHGVGKALVARGDDRRDARGLQVVDYRFGRRKSESASQ